MSDIATGLAAQFGYALEPSYGALTTPTDFVEFASESLKANDGRIESAGLGGRRHFTRSNRWARGARDVSGSVEHEIANQGFAQILEVCLGGDATVEETATGSGFWRHTFVPGKISKSLTLQVGRPGSNFVVVPFTYTGCIPSEFTIGANVDEIATFSANYVGADEDRVEPLASAVLPADDDLLVYTGGTLTVDGAEAKVSSFDFSGTNPLADSRRALGSRTRRQPLQNNLRDYTGTFEADFTDDTTLYDHYVNGTEASLVLVLSGPGETELRLTGNVRFDGDTANVGGPDEVRQPLTFKCIDDGSGPGSALTVEYVSTVAEL